ncbi:MAG: S8 family serine peptidase [Alistipes sp.]|jgi:subtilisin family serine protease|nr:S8 family serine peptidase [Alistipes sp.]
MKTNVRKLSTIALLLSVCLVSCTQDFKETTVLQNVAAQGSTGISADVDFFYSGNGEKVSFNIRKDKVIIKAHSEAKAKELAQQPVFLSTHYIGDIWMLALIDPAKTTLDVLLDLPGVVDATFGLEYADGTIKYPTDVIYVNSRDEMSIEKDLREIGLSKNIKSIELFNSYSKGYNIKTDVKLGDVLRICRKLSESGLYKNAEPSSFLELKSHNVYYGNQWGFNNTGQYGEIHDTDINVEQAWRITRGDSNIKVAVIDEGVDLGHIDLQANLLQGYDAIPSAYNPGGANGSPYANNAHGTACAGIIGAINNTTGVVGVAPNCKIVPVRIAYDPEDGRGWISHEDWIADGIHYAWHTAKADVLSNSWGGSWSNKITDAIYDASTQGREGKGCVIVFSSGNDSGGYGAPVSYPARLPYVISVGAISYNGARKTPATPDGENWGSNYGPELDVVAPGVLIPTTDIRGGAGYNPTTPIHLWSGGNKRSSDYTDQDYTVWFNGTSAACPHVSGIAALILSAYPDFTRQQVVTLIQSTANRYPNRNNEYGYGLVNAQKALFSNLSIYGEASPPLNTNETYSVPPPPERVQFLNWSVTGSTYTITGGLNNLQLTIKFTGFGTYILKANFRLPDGSTYSATKAVTVSYSPVITPSKTSVMRMNDSVLFTVTNPVTDATYDWEINGVVCTTPHWQYHTSVMTVFGDGSPGGGVPDILDNLSAALQNASAAPGQLTVRCRAKLNGISSEWGDMVIIQVIG